MFLITFIFMHNSKAIEIKDIGKRCKRSINPKRDQCVQYVFMEFWSLELKYNPYSISVIFAKILVKIKVNCLIVYFYKWKWNTFLKTIWIWTWQIFDNDGFFHKSAYNTSFNSKNDNWDWFKKILVYFTPKFSQMKMKFKKF